MLMMIRCPCGRTKQCKSSNQRGERRAGLVVSDFIQEKDGYLAFSDTMFQSVSAVDPTLAQSAQLLFEYGKSKEGYWTNELFMKQLRRQLRWQKQSIHLVFTSMYIFYIFDHSCGHTAYSPDALVVSRLSKKPGKTF